MITFKVDFDKVDKLEEAIKENCSRDIVVYKRWGPRLSCFLHLTTRECQIYMYYYLNRKNIPFLKMLCSNSLASTVPALWFEKGEFTEDVFETDQKRREQKEDIMLGICLLIMHLWWKKAIFSFLFHTHMRLLRILKFILYTWYGSLFLFRAPQSSCFSRCSYNCLVVSNIFLSTD